MTNSRQKGKRGENEAARYLCSLGFDAERAARCGVRGGEDLIVRDLPNVHIEVKRDESLRDDGALMAKYWCQAYHDAGPKQRTALLWRTNRRNWRLTFASVEILCLVTTTGDERIKTALLRLNERGA